MGDDPEELLRRGVYHKVLDLVQQGLAAGANPNCQYSDGDPIILAAVTYATPVIIQLLIDRGADVNAADNSGYTVLMAVAGNGNEMLVRYLVERGADINARTNTKQRTALMEAAQSNSFGIVRYLVERGADVNAEDNNGKKAIDFAEREDIKKYLNAAAQGQVPIGGIGFGSPVSGFSTSTINPAQLDALRVMIPAVEIELRNNITRLDTTRTFIEMVKLLLK